MKFYVKYMVSIRCRKIVHDKFEKLGLAYKGIDMSEVEVKDNITLKQREKLREELFLSGFELLDDSKAGMIEKIKDAIIDLVHYSEELPKIKNSDFLSDKLDYDYTYMANLFSEATGITIEHYIISQKIERAKHLLLFDDLNLTEIAYKLNYCNVGHLSQQFKKVTGLTPTFFKHLKQKKHTTEK